MLSWDTVVISLYQVGLGCAILLHGQLLKVCTEQSQQLAPPLLCLQLNRHVCSVSAGVC